MRNTSYTFKQLAFSLKNRVALKFFTALKYILSFRIFEQHWRALKNTRTPMLRHKWMSNVTTVMIVACILHTTR